MILRCPVITKYAVKNRIVVPASITSATESSEAKSRIIVWVSRASARFDKLSFPPAKALIIKALLDSDLEEGKGISVWKDCWIFGRNIVFKREYG